MDTWTMKIKPQSFTEIRNALVLAGVLENTKDEAYRFWHLIEKLVKEGKIKRLERGLYTAA